jgi:hypothetical protein
MKTLKVTYIVPGTDAPSARVEAHGTGDNLGSLVFSNGQAEKDLPAGKYVLRWRAKGVAPNTEYTIKITAPPESVFDPVPPKRSTKKGNIEAQRTFTILP